MEKVLRASQAGFPCERNLWYSVNIPKTDEGQTSMRTQRIFDVGTCLEPLIVDWLRQDGWEVEYNAPLEVSIPLSNGRISGHPDCFISRGSVKNCLVDIKTMNDRAFTNWKRVGTLKSKPQYVDQLHIYAEGCRAIGRTIERLGIVGVNKNNSEMHIDMFDFDPLRMEEILSRSERVVSSEKAPTHESPRESWCCGYCEYRGICDMYSVPFSPEADVEISETDDESVIGAMRLLKEARDLGKESRERESEAKAILDGYMKSSGHRNVQGGGLMFRLLERETTKFDTAAFRKEHPELVGEYQRTSTSLVYDIKELMLDEDS